MPLEALSEYRARSFCTIHFLFHRTAERPRANNYDNQIINNRTSPLSRISSLSFSSAVRPVTASSLLPFESYGLFNELQNKAPSRSRKVSLRLRFACTSVRAAISAISLSRITRDAVHHLRHSQSCPLSRFEILSENSSGKNQLPDASELGYSRKN